MISELSRGYENDETYKKRDSKELTFSVWMKNTEKNDVRSFSKGKILFASIVSSQTRPCPTLSIQGISRHHSSSFDDPKYAPHCKPWNLTQDTCDLANYFYLDRREDIYCNSKSEVKDENIICSFINKHYQSTVHVFKTRCDPEICQSGRLFVGSIDSDYGIIPLKNWLEFGSAKALELALPGIVLGNIQKGFSFCLIRCVKNEGNIDQLFTFPQILRKYQQKKSAKKRKPFHINVVVIDSVSRNHFYRMLPNTIHALTEAANKLKVKILDYEFLQSLAPYTYTNVRAFMTGDVDQEFLLQLNKTYGINKLFGVFKKHGYKTLLQEESCWYDYWGTILGSNIRRDKLPNNLQEFRESWSFFRNITNEYEIDDYGLTHFSCIVYSMYKVTNMFNKPLKICYSGKPFGSHTLNYVQNVFTSADKTNKNGPIFSYLHANTGHEVTGLRIKVIDQPLATFVKKMAKLKNTLTVILSDHGPKTTKYSQKYLHGRYETYDSFLFMIVPEKVQRKLGKRRMETLVKNQKSLVTTKDLHETLTGIISKAESLNQTGLFSNAILNRTCDSLPLAAYGVCKCRGWEKIYDNQSSKFTWLAEFATGILNNKIQEQFSRNNRSGFGRCQRLRLHSIRNIRRRVSKNYHITTFDLVVQPFDIVFLIQTRHLEKDNVKNVEFELWRRVSIFRHFSRCKDPSVELELCACSTKYRSSSRNVLEIAKDVSMNGGNRIINTSSRCLYIISRRVNSEQGLTTTYEVLNSCSGQYNFTVYGSPQDVAISSRFPVVKQLKPNTIHFLFSTFVQGKRKHTKFKYYITKICNHVKTQSNSS